MSPSISANARSALTFAAAGVSGRATRDFNSAEAAKLAVLLEFTCCSLAARPLSGLDPLRSRVLGLDPLRSRVLGLPGLGILVPGDLRRVAAGLLRQIDGLTLHRGPVQRVAVLLVPCLDQGKPHRRAQRSREPANIAPHRQRQKLERQQARTFEPAKQPTLGVAGSVRPLGPPPGVHPAVFQAPHRDTAAPGAFALILQRDPAAQHRRDRFWPTRLLAGPLAPAAPDGAAALELVP